MTTTSRLRADDTDRQAAVEDLARHLADGRIDLNEYDQRVARAYAVTYTDEFEALFADLPSRGRTGFDAKHGFPFTDDADGTEEPSGRRTQAPWDSLFGSQIGDAVRNRQFGEAWRSSQQAFRKSQVGATINDAVRGRSGRPHPVVIALAVIGALIVIGTLISALVPLLVIAGLIYLFSGRHGCSGSARNRRNRSHDAGSTYRRSYSGW